ncbi:hypothetical protein CCAX7_34510 [Capsulimonas corticalis]|uniref:Uncharacterized protein n=1 Tax=Capsulimonas corticalis TaxID=2219043 RepID=A0A402CYC1_9BACT|nr:hypothetical protein [Capsulimonas corticalis]BDI31400.1 hypothetical protein CCAX7_34510 [Capsulimonas corticalis]
MAQNGNADRKLSVPLTMADQDDDMDLEEGESYIVVGEAGEDVAFEICEDLEIALGVRDAMQEDGFVVRMFQAHEVDIVIEEEPSKN